MQSASIAYVLPRTVWAWLVGLLCIIALTFQAGLEKAINAWVGSEEYSHALLVPLIAGYMAWQRRDALTRSGFQGSWAALAVVLAGMALQVVGRIAALYVVQQVALLVVFYGVALSLLGWRGIAVLRVPLLLMIFMVPLPQLLLQNLSASLQLLSSQIGVAVIRIAGISVYVEGNVIDLGGFQLQVAEACSGLRYLFPLMTLGLIIAYFFRAPLWARALVFVSSVPVTVIMNGLRVGAIGILVEHWGARMAEGFLHDFEGWVVFMASVAVLLFEVRLLAWMRGDRRAWRQIFGLDAPAPDPRGGRLRVPIPPPLLAATALLALFAVMLHQLPDRIESVPARSGLSTFPMQIGDRTGRHLPMDQKYLDALKLDDYLLADFARADDRGLPFNLYVAWYDSQTAGESVHSPRSCIPGGGWSIAQLDQRNLDGAAAGGRSLPYNRVLIEHQGQRQLVYYWFQQRGRLLTNEYAVKRDLFVDAVRRQRTDGALIRIVAPLRSGQLPEDVDRELGAFVRRLAPLLPAYVPD